MNSSGDPILSRSSTLKKLWSHVKTFVIPSKMNVKVLSRPHSSKIFSYHFLKLLVAIPVPRNWKIVVLSSFIQLSNGQCQRDMFLYWGLCTLMSTGYGFVRGSVHFNVGLYGGLCTWTSTGYQFVSRSECVNVNELWICTGVCTFYVNRLRICTGSVHFNVNGIRICIEVGIF